MSFFCAEYGIHASLPIYSGGLGALAGDILKEASDRALPLVAVGLLYRQGYFRQRIDASGWQHEYVGRRPIPSACRWRSSPATTASRSRSPSPSAPSRSSRRSGASTSGACRSSCSTPTGPRTARWRAGSARACTPATRDLRLAQYLLLGVGGMRALRGDGDRPGGRAPQRGPRRLRLAGAGARRAGRAARRSTTRWPRPARAPSSPRTRRCRPATTPTSPSWSSSRWARWPTRSASTSTRSSASGRTRPDDDGEPFGVTQFALHTSRSGNGVSRRHGEVAREMWAALWPDRAVDDVPIGYVTNGVHLPTWLGDPMRALLDRHLGEGWMDRAADPATWDGARRRSTTPSCGPRAASSAPRSSSWARERSMVDRLGRDEPREYVEAPRLRPRRAHDRLRPAPGHLQAPARAAAERRGDRRPALGRAPDPDPHGRQGAPARRRRQAQPAGAVRAPRASPRSAAASPTSTTTTSTHRRAARARAATCGSTSRARRWRPAARAG